MSRLTAKKGLAAKKEWWKQRCSMLFSHWDCKASSTSGPTTQAPVHPTSNTTKTEMLDAEIDIFSNGLEDFSMKCYVQCHGSSLIKGNKSTSLCIQFH